jgi:hypothetical protein
VVVLNGETSDALTINMSTVLENTFVIFDTDGDDKCILKQRNVRVAEFVDQVAVLTKYFPSCFCLTDFTCGNCKNDLNTSPPRHLVGYVYEPKDIWYVKEDFCRSLRVIQKCRFTVKVKELRVQVRCVTILLSYAFMLLVKNRPMNQDMKTKVSSIISPKERFNYLLYVFHGKLKNNAQAENIVMNMADSTFHQSATSSFKVEAIIS